MAIQELFDAAGEKRLAIHTGQQYFKECLEWLNAQDFRSFLGIQMQSTYLPMNVLPAYGDQTCIVVYHQKYLYDEPLYQCIPTTYYVVEYEDIIQGTAFDDVDEIL